MIALFALLAASPVPASPTPQVEYNHIWARSVGTSTIDELTALASDGDGGAIAGGYSFGSLFGMIDGGPDGTLRRVDAGGFESWAVQFGSPGTDAVASVATDDLGHVFAVGFTSDVVAGTTQGMTDMFVACFDLQGQSLWIEQFGSAGNDVGLSVVADGMGGCLVAGTTSGDFGGSNAGENDIFVARVDGTGVLGTVAQIGSPADERSPVILNDGSGGYFLSATTQGDLGGPAVGATDVFLGRFDSADAELWSLHLGTSQVEIGFDLASDGMGGIFVSGSTQGDLAGPNAGSFDRIVGRYDATGTEQFLIQTGTSDMETGARIAWDSMTNRLYVAGTRSEFSQVFDDVYLGIYDANGVALGQRNFGEFRRDIVADVIPSGAGGVLLGGFGFSDFGGVNDGVTDQFIARFEPVVGSLQCSPAVPNSTGLPGRLRASGSTVAGKGNLHLFVDQLPTASACFFLTSMTPGMTPMAGGSEGTLCLGGEIGRYVGPGQVQLSDAGGTVQLLLDLTQVPTPTGFVTVMPGQSWRFQAWNRDIMVTATSNFSNAVVVDFQ